MAEVNTNSDHRYELLFPRMLGIFTRMRLWFHGYFDALTGKVQLSRKGYVTSPYCKSLADNAEYRLNAEWQACTGAMFEIRPKLVDALLEREEVLLREKHLNNQKETLMEQASIVYEGDIEVSEHLRQRRINRRKSLAESYCTYTETELKDMENNATSKVEKILNEFQDCRDIANTHDRIVRVDYMARLSAYVRGASRRLNINSRFVNDKAVSTASKDENDKLFSTYLEGELPKVTMQNSSGEVERFNS